MHPLVILAIVVLLALAAIICIFAGIGVSPVVFMSTVILLSTAGAVLLFVGMGLALGSVHLGGRQRLQIWFRNKWGLLLLLLAFSAGVDAFVYYHIVVKYNWAAKDLCVMMYDLGEQRPSKTVGPFSKWEDAKKWWDRKAKPIADRLKGTPFNQNLRRDAMVTKALCAYDLHNYVAAQGALDQIFESDAHAFIWRVWFGHAQNPEKPFDVTLQEKLESYSTAKGTAGLDKMDLGNLFAYRGKAPPEKVFYEKESAKRLWKAWAEKAGIRRPPQRKTGRTEEVDTWWEWYAIIKPAIHGVPASQDRFDDLLALVRDRASGDVISAGLEGVLPELSKEGLWQDKLKDIDWRKEDGLAEARNLLAGIDALYLMIDRIAKGVDSPDTKMNEALRQKKRGALRSLRSSMTRLLVENVRRDLKAVCEKLEGDLADIANNYGFTSRSGAKVSAFVSRYSAEEWASQSSPGKGHPPLQLLADQASRAIQDVDDHLDADFKKELSHLGAAVNGISALAGEKVNAAAYGEKVFADARDEARKLGEKIQAMSEDNARCAAFIFSAKRDLYDKWCKSFGKVFADTVIHAVKNGMGLCDRDALGGHEGFFGEAPNDKIAIPDYLYRFREQDPYVVKAKFLVVSQKKLLQAERALTGQLRKRAADMAKEWAIDLNRTRGTCPFLLSEYDWSVVPTRREDAYVKAHALMMHILYRRRSKLNEPEPKPKDVLDEIENIGGMPVWWKHLIAVLRSFPKMSDGTDYFKNGYSEMPQLLAQVGVGAAFTQPDGKETGGDKSKEEKAYENAVREAWGIHQATLDAWLKLRAAGQGDLPPVYYQAVLFAQAPLWFDFGQGEWKTGILAPRGQARNGLDAEAVMWRMEDLSALQTALAETRDLGLIRLLLAVTQRAHTDKHIRGFSPAQKQEIKARVDKQLKLCNNEFEAIRNQTLTDDQKEQSEKTLYFFPELWQAAGSE